MSEKVTLHLEKGHKKLLKGGTVQLSKAHLMGERGEPVELMVNKMLAKKIKDAKRKGKAVRVSLTEGEIEGGNLRDFFQKVAKFYREKIKPDLAPVLKKGVKSLVETAAPALNVIPVVGSDLAKLASDKSESISQQLGDWTGAFGMHPMMMYGGAMAQLPYIPYIPYSQSLSPIDPKWSAPLPSPGFGEVGSYYPAHMMMAAAPPAAKKKGGNKKKKEVSGASFKPIGGSFSVI